MKEQEELLSQRMKDILSNTKNLQLTDFITNNQKDEVSIEEGALITLLAEARRRNWAQDHTISYLKNETGLAMEIGRAQFDSIDHTLEKIRARKTQLASFRCRTYYEIYNSWQGRTSQPGCLIELTLICDKGKKQKVVFACTSIAQLQDLLSQFKEIVHNVKKRRTLNL